ncbi:unnamed protein product [Acanthoscelides obtectus]|uniref:MADF domain-containing protein n=1 Tax=Acanthoscelides obtectus TaxID=200917 RepID=A0A9P0PA12_ACAOB|nr:unnamed protein product [Acanthoscelides obtectus]CAK1624760.1 hypothetical protein AOBTE_LOCUS2745 [Acanthoscelides obtectus]
MDTERLIMLVHEQECLWNLNSENYHSRDLQRKAWKEIASEMKCTDIMTPRTLEGSVPEPESEATDINEADVEHDDNDNISTEQSPPTTPTTSQTLLPQIHQSPQSSSSSSKRLFKSPPKKKNRRQNEAAKYDEAFLRIEQEKLKYFKGPVQDSEMHFLMSLHPFLKKNTRFSTVVRTSGLDASSHEESTHSIIFTNSQSRLPVIE